MTTSHQPQPLSLSAFDLSAERGFLPMIDPLKDIPDEPVLNQLGADLPKLLTARHFRHVIQDRKEIMGAVADEWGLDAYRCAMRTLSFAAHAYVWEDPDHPATRLPACLALPWHTVAQQLGRPPVLSYASYALHNWRRLDPQKPRPVRQPLHQPAPLPETGYRILDFLVGRPRNAPRQPRPALWRRQLADT